jgi:ubiquinone/menaquinone biosynthesis C-methylase UbiE
LSLLVPPHGQAVLPHFEDGWIVSSGEHVPYLSYAADVTVNWSEELEHLHEESTRTHFIDVWTRQALLEAIGDLQPGATIADIGCSTGHLLAELRMAHPDATLVGVDLVASGLLTAHALVPSARLLQADVCDLPLTDVSVDAVVSANLLEHVQDDRRALAEVWRALRPGACAAFVVPFGPGTYDYYDRFLGHVRRYGRGELAGKAREAGLHVVTDTYLASLLYPAFWLAKQRNRRWYTHLNGMELEQRVAADIAATSDSRLGSVLRSIEERLHVRLPFGIRNLVVVRRSSA